MRAGFAANLGRFRQMKGISQRQAAQDLQVSQALLSHYEKGIREPGLDFVVRAADYYHVTTDQLLNYNASYRNRRSNRCNHMAEEMEEGIRDGLDFILGALGQHYDPEVCYYAYSYLGEALYELIRNLAGEFFEYDSDWYNVTEERFKSGAVTSDMAWLRSQYIMSLRKFREQYQTLPPVSVVELKEFLGEQFESVSAMLHMVDRRLLRFGAEDDRLTKEFAALTEANRTPEEEEK